MAIDLDGELRLFDIAAQKFSLLDTGGRYVVNPAYSPDGRMLAYYGITTKAGQPVSCDLWLRELAASRTGGVHAAHDRKIASAVVPVDREVPIGEIALQVKTVLRLAWSPDGRRLAHSRETATRGEIELLDVTTGSATSLGTPTESQFLPAWSPDGRRLTYVAEARSSRAGSFAEGALHVYVRDADGARKQRLWNAQTQGEIWPYSPATWTADGRHVVVLRQRTRSDRLEARVVPAAGGDGRLLILFTTPFGTISPDLKAAVYIGGDEPLVVVYRAAPFTTSKILDQLPAPSEEPSEDAVYAAAYPVLSPDGHWVALPLSTSPRELRLYRVPGGEKRIYRIDSPSPGTGTLRSAGRPSQRGDPDRRTIQPQGSDGHDERDTSL